MSKKNFKKFLLPILALNLIPLVAHGQEVPAKKPTRFDDLTASELATAFRNFEPVIDGRDPSNRAVLFGMIFDDCKDKFDISNTNMDATLHKNGVVGFRITDVDGKGRECMAKHKVDVCGNKNPCTRISQLPGANFDLSNSGDAKIQLLHIDPDRDLDQLQPEDFPGKTLAHVSQATIEAKRAEEERARKDATIKLLKKQVASCRKTDADRETALAAADTLHSFGLMTDDEVDKLTKELASFQLNSLGRQFLNTPIKDEAKLADLTEQLKAFEAEHPESADNIAELMRQKALAFAKGANTPEAYDKASAMIAEAQGFSGLNDLAASRLANYQRDISVGRFQAMAMSGNTDPYAFWQPYSSFMWDLQTGMRTCSGPQMQGENCRSMISAYKAASQIPQQAQQSQYEQYMFYMRMQQQMTQFNGMGGAFTNGAMPMGGAQQTSGFYR